MTSVLDLARPELRSLRPYTPGAYAPGLVRLNANESPWRLPGDKTERGLNVYPPPRPAALRDALAAHSGVRGRWRWLTLDQRRAELASVVKAVIVKPATKRGSGFHPEFVSVVFQPVEGPWQLGAA